MKKFRAAYGSEHVRPKVHFSRHLREQVDTWKRHIDCFMTERKNKIFKRQIAPRLNRLSSFSASALMELTQSELNTTHVVDRLVGQLVGKGKPHLEWAKEVHVTPDALFATGIEVGCVEFLRGHFLVLHPTLCLEIHHGMKIQPNCQQWRRNARASKYVLPAHKMKGHVPLHLMRKEHEIVWLLR